MPTALNQGVKIHYEVEGQGPPLLMLTGFLASAEDMHDFGYVEKLREDFKLILMDHRGHGQSDKPHDASQYSVQLFLEDIVAVLADAGVERCHVYGHSMGGWFIYGLARYYPDRMLSAIIADGVPGSGDPEMIRMMMGKYAEFIHSIDGLTDAAKERWLGNDLEALSAMAEWVGKKNDKLIDLVDSAIDEIDIPCLVLMSDIPEDSDEYVLLNKTAAAVPNAELAQFNELSHLDLFFRSDLVFPKIQKFLEAAISN